MSKRATLTTRQKSIIRILTRMDGRPITVAVISEKLGVSTRTILREVPAIEKWMSDNDFNFERKPGVGMLVGEAPETLRFIEELLDADNLVPMYSRQERRKHILGEPTAPFRKIWMSWIHGSGITMFRSSAGPAWASSWKGPSWPYARPFPTRSLSSAMWKGFPG